MDEVVSIAAVAGEPGLIAYEYCKDVTSGLVQPKDGGDPTPNDADTSSPWRALGADANDALVSLLAPSNR
jgi:hypothetical protein